MPRNARQDRVTVGNLRKMTPGIILVPEKVLKDPILSKWINIKNHHLLRVFVKGGAFLRFSEGVTPAKGKLLKAGVAKVKAVVKGADTPAVKAFIDLKIRFRSVDHPTIRLTAKKEGPTGDAITVEVKLVSGAGNALRRDIIVTKGAVSETVQILFGANTGALRTRVTNGFAGSTLIDATVVSTNNTYSRIALSVLAETNLAGGADLIPGTPAEPEIPAIPAVYADPIPRSLPPADAKIATDTSEDTVYVNSGAAGSTVAHTILCKADYVRIAKEAGADEVKRLELS